jgi:hypothetical protein
LTATDAELPLTLGLLFGIELNLLTLYQQSFVTPMKKTAVMPCSRLNSKYCLGSRRIAYFFTVGVK